MPEQELTTEELDALSTTGGEMTREEFEKLADCTSLPTCQCTGRCETHRGLITCPRKGYNQTVRLTADEARRRAEAVRFSRAHPVVEPRRTKPLI